MQEQFAHYTRYVTLRPFGGDPSLDFKWAAAKHLELIADVYPDKPIVILYFGDLDPKGEQIPESAALDVRTWSAAPFEFVRCGLNPGDEIRFNLPENFEKPGTYQWEAMTDTSAQKLIMGRLERYTDIGAMAEVEAQEREIEKAFKLALSPLLRQWEEMEVIAC